MHVQSFFAHVPSHAIVFSRSLPKFAMCQVATVMFVWRALFLCMNAIFIYCPMVARYALHVVTHFFFAVNFFFFAKKKRNCKVVYI